MLNRGDALPDLAARAVDAEERIAAAIGGLLREIKHEDSAARRRALANADAERQAVDAAMSDPAQRDEPSRKLWAELSDEAKARVGFMCAEGDYARPPPAGGAAAVPPEVLLNERKLLEMENMTACLVIQHLAKAKEFCPTLPNLRMSEVERGHPADNITWDENGCAHGLDLFTPPDVATAGPVAGWSTETKVEFIEAYHKHCKNAKVQENTAADHSEPINVIGILDVTDYQAEERAALLALLEPEGLRALRDQLNPDDDSVAIAHIDAMIPDPAQLDSDPTPKKGKGNCVIIDRNADGDGMIVAAQMENPIEEDPDDDGAMNLDWLEDD